MHGGNPHDVTLRGFIDAAASLLVDEYRRLGIDLLSALAKVGLLGMSDAPTAAAAVPDVVDNQQSMTQLMGMMGGVKGAPV